MAGNVPLLGHVMAELEAGTDGEADGVAAGLQQVGKQVIVNQIPLHHQAEVFSDVEGDTAPEAVERSPFLLLAGRGYGTYHQPRKGIGWVRRNHFVDNAGGRSNVGRNALESPVRKFGADGEGLGHRAEWKGGYVIGRKKASRYESGQQRAELGLQRGGGLVQTDACVARAAAIIEAHADVARPAHARLDVNAGFGKTDLRTVQIHISCIDQESTDIRVFRQGGRLLPEGAGDSKEQRGGQEHEAARGWDVAIRLLGHGSLFSECRSR